MPLSSARPRKGRRPRGFSTTRVFPAPCAVRPRIGYLTDFNGLGLTTALAKDLTISCPYNKTPTYTPLGGITNGRVSVTAVLEEVSWGGAAGDAFSFSCYMSQQNAMLLRALNKM